MLIICAFENQRWVRSQSYSSSLVRELVENTGVLAVVGKYGFLLLYGWDLSFWSALALFTWGFIVTAVYVLLMGMIAPGDHPFVWMLCSVLLYLVAFILASKVTWFGFFSENTFALY